MLTIKILAKKSKGKTYNIDRGNYFPNLRPLECDAFPVVILAKTKK